MASKPWFSAPAPPMCPSAATAFRTARASTMLLLTPSKYKPFALQYLSNCFKEVLLIIPLYLELSHMYLTTGAISLVATILLPLFKSLSRQSNAGSFLVHNDHI